MPPKEAHVLRHFLLSQDPMLCGLVAQRDFLDMQKFGTKLAAKDKYIIAAAHLYHAAKSKGLLGKDVVWKDLEYMVEKLGDGLDFNCLRPQNDFISIRTSELHASTINLADPARIE
jgi:hypothetical protein